jgi:phage baseplate assembly protein W
MSRALSDFNSVTGKVSQRSARTKLYSDLNLRFNRHPQKNDLVPFYDLDAVKNSVKNLVLSGPNDRLFHPELGCGLGALLFELVDIFTVISIRNEIIRVLVDHEPRISGIVVDAVDMPDENAYRITIAFSVTGSNYTEEVNFSLNRLR